jgi:hypothetical protein
MECSICGAGLRVSDMSCTNCGAPADDRAASGERSECTLCGDVLWSLAETCLHCHSRGFPALRPRLGDKAVGAPERELEV